MCMYVEDFGDDQNYWEGFFFGWLSMIDFYYVIGDWNFDGVGYQFCIVGFDYGLCGDGLYCQCEVVV